MAGIPANTRPLEGPAPRLQAPPGTIDCHIHIYSEGHEPQPGGPPIAELATVDDYAVVQKRLGLERTIVVQANAYQFDNGAALEALDHFGKEKARAVVALRPDMRQAELKALHERGVRGARIMNLPGGATKIADMEPIERLARDMDWSLIVQFDGREIEDHLDALNGIGTRYTIDHDGKFLEPVPADDRRVDHILRLIDRGNAWFKVCAPYETSRTGAPAYEDVGAIARRVIAHAPERIVWGSNWPHVGVSDRADYPDDAHLLDVLLDWAPDDEVRRKILVDNPAELYGF